MKLQFLLAGIVATGLFASAPDAVAHRGAARFTGAAAFMAAKVFTGGVVSGAFAAGILGTFAAGVSGTFTAIAVFSTVIVFSFPVSVSMGTRGGGIGVIPIIGVIRTILITRTITQITPAHTTVTMRTTAIDSSRPSARTRM